MSNARPGLGQPAALIHCLFLFFSNPEADIIAEIGVEEQNELEMQGMRNQVSACSAGTHVEGGGRIMVFWGGCVLTVMRSA